MAASNHDGDENEARHGSESACEGGVFLRKDALVLRVSEQKTERRTIVVPRERPTVPYALEISNIMEKTARDERVSKGREDGDEKRTRDRGRLVVADIPSFNDAD